METQSTNDVERAAKLKAACEKIKQQVAKAIVGQDEVINQLLIAILARGHCLLQGVPGLAKTLMVRSLADAMHLNFHRIQFTPDLMPSDVLGVSIFNNQKSAFEFKKGPVFANLVLIDEINRAPAKTQAALFEVMEERQITIDGVTYPMELPFLVIATQNPIEQEGTYRLPEAQLDRFLFLININYPELDDEVEILRREHHTQVVEKLKSIEAVVSATDIVAFQTLVQQILVEENLLKYIAGIVTQTRNHPFLFLGASPRASLAILKASKAFAAIQGRDFVTPEDIKKVAVHVLIHRVVVAPEREMEGVSTQQIIQQIIETVEIPR